MLVSYLVDSAVVSIQRLHAGTDTDDIELYMGLMPGLILMIELLTADIVSVVSVISHNSTHLTPVITLYTR